MNGIQRPTNYTEDIQYANIADVSKWNIVSPLEFYSSCKALDINAKWDETNSCPICKCELFEGVLSTDDQTQMMKQILGQHKIFKQKSDDVSFLQSNLPVWLPKCNGLHMYHKDCLKQQMGAKTFVRCSVCQVSYGIRIGDMPTNGVMKWRTLDKQIEGYPVGTKTIDMFYDFPSGSKDGQYYRRTSRQAFLPDTPEGITVFKMLKLGFERKLNFTVGISVTTGQYGVIWSGIHHKTSPFGGSSNFGYPDPGYFIRVKQELADRGISEADVANLQHTESGQI